MKASYKIVLSSVAQYLCIGFILLYSANCLHEILHLRILVFLGGDGYIVLRGFTAETVPTIMPPNADIVATAGLIVSTLYSLIAYIGYRRKFAELYAALIPTITIQLVYGVFETLFWRVNTADATFASFVVTVLSALTGLFVSAYLLYRSLKKTLLCNR